MAADDAPRAEGPAPVQISRLRDGYLARQLLSVAAKPGLADDLAGAPHTADTLAPGVGAKPGALCRVRRGLSAEGVLAEHPDWRFSRTALETCLRNDMRLGAILRPVPRLQRVLLDQPPVVARQARLASAGLAGRCACIAADSFAGVPLGGDASIFGPVSTGVESER